MTDKKTKPRAEKILNRLKNNYPDVKTALKSETPFQLLIATIVEMVFRISMRF